MYKISIRNFKAFDNNEIVFGHKEVDSTKPTPNILCYGDNGTGKTSVYEAIMWIFFHDKIIDRNVSKALTGESREAAIRQQYINRNNKINDTDFTININDVDYQTFDTSLYHVYMFDGKSVEVSHVINMDELLETICYGKGNLSEILNEEALKTIIQEVNAALRDFFLEQIKIEKSESGEFRIAIVDPIHRLQKDQDLSVFFNEAKIHLVKLLLILSSIEILSPTQADLRRIIVMDDIFTSLDSANRIFIFQYIVKHFSRFQIVLLTHNINFFNLAEHLINNHYSYKSNWMCLSLYESNNSFKIYEKRRLTTSILKKSFEKGEPIQQIGTDVRKYFEILLHQIAELTMVDAKEENKKILEDLYKAHHDRDFYVTEDKIERLSDLFKAIRHYLISLPEEKQLSKIKEVISEYDSKSEGDVLIPTLEAMTIFQKVALHKTAHGHSGLPDMSLKEIKASINVLEKLEKIIDKINLEKV